MPCQMCEKRGKNWEGGDPTCAFTDTLFSPDNWNCATVNAIRDIVYEGQELQEGVAYQYCDDMKYATIDVSDIEGVMGYCLWVCWYKNRGGTDALWLLDSRDRPRPPTEGECRRIIEHYEGKSA